jgi:hypothetical protein
VQDEAVDDGPDRPGCAVEDLLALGDDLRKLLCLRAEFLEEGELRA